jgi:hypothetical protein
MAQPLTTFGGLLQGCWRAAWEHPFVPLVDSHDYI